MVLGPPPHQCRHRNSCPAMLSTSWVNVAITCARSCPGVTVGSRVSRYAWRTCLIRRGAGPGSSRHRTGVSACGRRPCGLRTAGGAAHGGPGARGRSGRGRPTPTALPTGTPTGTPTATATPAPVQDDRPSQARQRWHVRYRRAAVLADVATAVIAGAPALLLPSTARACGSSPSSPSSPSAGWEPSLSATATRSATSAHRRGVPRGLPRGGRAVLPRGVRRLRPEAGYRARMVLVSVPLLLVLGLLARHALRRSLYRRRTRGWTSSAPS